MDEGLVVIVRGVIGFFTLLIFTKLLGKQQISQLTLFEYILGITIGSIAATLTTDLTSSAWSHWMGLFIWSFLVFLLQHIVVRFPLVSEYINGQPELIIVNGKLMDKKMKSLRYSLSDLLEQLRSNNVFDISQVEFAVLETNGKLTVLKKSQYETVTAQDLGISTPYVGVSTEIIIYGMIIEENLKKIGLDKRWLKDELAKRKINHSKEIHLATINTSGELFIDLYKDYLNK
ncbi:MAG: DUF421 domain-containing protein [Firmicutes bacterium HGW-Firmicutes-1]|jgi:uncharacterized membrane protein YcaP (DUF421 family)|nr:MAG: DUF421 domain-containing protein [Firmicutes bacterium HGW-Firmicutes-1]